MMFGETLSLQVFILSVLVALSYQQASRLLATLGFERKHLYIFKRCIFKAEVALIFRVGYAPCCLGKCFAALWGPNDVR